MNGKELQQFLAEQGIVTEIIIHKEERRIRLIFNARHHATSLVRQIKEIKWSNSLGSWHLPVDKTVLEELVRLLASAPLTPIFIPNSENKYSNNKLSEKGASSGGENAVSIENTGIELNTLTKSLISHDKSNHRLMTIIVNFTDKIKLKGYSKNTLVNYRNHFCQFLKVVWQIKEPDMITKYEIEKYLRWRQIKKTLSESDQNLHINAIKFYYEVVLGRTRMLFDLPRPKKPKQLPAVWSEEDVLKLFRVMNNEKHRLMLIMAYAHGMRVSEISDLRIRDIDSKRMQIHIKAAKGKKDRVVNLSESALQAMRKYYKNYKPVEYLFENDLSKQKISVRTIQEVFSFAKKKAGLKKKAGIHSLRHSYATHLHEQGVDIKYLKELLGHNSLKTTEKYTHVSKKDIGKIKSPLDKLKLD